MRKIRFRAWDKINKRMFQVGLISISLEFVREIGDSISYYPFDRIILMRFIRLTDKHGIDIYEGDIIKFGDTYGTIRWSVDETKFYVSASAQNTEFNNGLWRINIGRDSHLIVVIGNVYENPELLQLEV